MFKKNNKKKRWAINRWLSTTPGDFLPPSFLLSYSPPSPYLTIPAPTTRESTPSPASPSSLSHLSAYFYNWPPSSAANYGAGNP